jgi:hypothetical protein
MISFYQDRLRTNIAKALKKRVDAFSHRCHRQRHLHPARVSGNHEEHNEDVFLRDLPFKHFSIGWERPEGHVNKTSTTGLFFEFSLCLSRACLGKKIVFILKKSGFLQALNAPENAR